ncbi:MAG: nucleotidyl transferase [Acidobacteria bacterium]|jgi:dTDP-glucose pyrophosphorylase|nr:nucleotidyl transferase [Acidobacteriota bacterium]|tara:strand:+ start:130 stop:1200 length:1071 start_codon:yes stop_codon:yes gene_type:complete
MDKVKLKSLLISPDTALKESMQKLNETAEQILFVTDKDDKLLGTVTDGDIRRGLINGLKFRDKVEKVMFRQFVSFCNSEPDKKEKAQEKMINEEVEQIPILNENKQIIDVISWTDIFSQKKSVEQKQLFVNKVVIMAGGKGTRLAPFTKILPKPLIPIKEKPIIEIIMEKLYKCGFHNFVYTLNYKKEYIKLFLRENDFPYSIDWVEENDYRGTAGSLSLLKDKVDDCFFVLNCDTILNVDYADMLKWHKEHNNFMTLVGCHKEFKLPYGILELDRGILKELVEKPNYDVIINTGSYILEPEILQMIPDNKCMDMDSLIETASKNGRVSVYPIHDGWIDIGQWEEYRESVKELVDD